MTRKGLIRCKTKQVTNQPTTQPTIMVIAVRNGLGDLSSVARQDFEFHTVLITFGYG